MIGRKGNSKLARAPRRFATVNGRLELYLENSSIIGAYATRSAGGGDSADT
jgi:hypothetical protein